MGRKGESILPATRTLVGGTFKYIPTPAGEKNPKPTDKKKHKKTKKGNLFFVQAEVPQATVITDSVPPTSTENKTDPSVTGFCEPCGSASARTSGSSGSSCSGGNCRSLGAGCSRSCKKHCISRNQHHVAAQITPRETSLTNFYQPHKIGGMRKSLKRKLNTAEVTGVSPDILSIKSINIFIDTGVLQANYINVDTADWLISKGAQVTECNSVVCSGIKNNKYSKCLGKICFNLKFLMIF